MRLKIQLVRDWILRPDVPGPAAFSRAGSTSILQVSWAEYRGDKPYRPLDEAGIREFAVKRGQSFGGLTRTSSGTCRFGIFGTAVFQSLTNPHCQVWLLTNGKDLIFATYVSSDQPSPNEISELEQIAQSLALGPE
jgi:hypothetical protein